MKILVTGGSGGLGRTLIAAGATRHALRVTSRREPARDGGVEWARADLVTGEGLAQAVNGVDVVVHAASDPRRAAIVDVGGTKKLLDAARAASVAHFVYVSIVGIHEIPFGYYQRKLETENLVVAGGIPYSILRATQFHSLLDTILASAARVPLILALPTTFRFQPVDAREVADRLLRAIDEGPRRRLRDFAGPEVLTLGEAAKAWKQARGVRKPIVHLPVPGRVAAAFKAGKNTTLDADLGQVRWRDWLGGNAAVPIAT
jgi:uncharacterized protein YbjT (DUF2867 family)